MRGHLIVNPRSGSGPGDLVAEARRLGVRTHVLAEGDDAAEIAGATDADVLGVAGGDGSLGPVAAVALERGLPFVCVPLGTRNHFARDLGIERETALRAFASGRETRVDVGRANGRVFLNNVSLGLYARLLRHRRRTALSHALWLALRDRHPEPFAVDGEAVTARVLLVANNAYELDLFDVGARERLDEGQLHLYLAGGLLPREWVERNGERFTIEQPGGLRAAVDGEPARFDSPLEVAIEPRALRILLP